MKNIEELIEKIRIFGRACEDLGCYSNNPEFSREKGLEIREEKAFKDVIDHIRNWVPER